uniref:PX domain-containing protein n=1 Tax=Graphocephala atropunctata TaxID=36148 RepID=A0A1B6MFY2_9HEMI
MSSEESLKEASVVTENDEHSIPEYLIFSITSTRIIHSSKKYVSYTITISKKGSTPDSHPSVIERRYTEFLELYTGLQHNYPRIAFCLPFPKKALFGNFSQEIITERSVDFRILLTFISKFENVMESHSTISFFVGKEQSLALKLISEMKYNEAVVPLEMTFRLLNKLFTNRHPLVLRSLCLLVACCDKAGDPHVRTYAQTAVTRFEAVSDVDSLRYYVPLLQLCVRLLPETEALQDRLSCMKRRGIRVEGCLPLLDTVLTDMPSTS